MTLTEQQHKSLTEYLALLRIKVDIELIKDYPYFSGKPYPLGRCKEIRNAVFDLLKKELASSPNEALSPLIDKLQAGHEIKQVWGSLRDEYFQNAMIVDDLYIDAANDTVNPNKPRVEITAAANSGFSAITSFEQFCTIAKRYWQVTLYRNDVFPALAPYFPIVCIAENNSCWFGAATNEMLELTMNSDFNESKSVLSLLPACPEHVIKKWRALTICETEPLLQKTGLPEQFIEQYKNKAKDLKHRDRIVTGFFKLPDAISL